MADELLGHLIDAAHAAIRSEAGMLDELGQEAGLEGHGRALLRGLAALERERPVLLSMSVPRALIRAGELLEAETGGESGMFYGRLLGGMGQAAPMIVASTADLVRMLGAGMEAVRAAGPPGLHVRAAHEILLPVLSALENAQASDALLHDAVGEARGAADRAAMVRPPAGAGSGGLDPLAASCRLLVIAICDAAEPALRG